MRHARFHPAAEVDPLDLMYDHPRFPNGFIVKTLPLPKNMTAGTCGISREFHLGSKIPCVFFLREARCDFVDGPLGMFGDEDGFTFGEFSEFSEVFFTAGIS